MDLDEVNEDGRTALMLAVIYSDVEIVKALVEADAKVELKCKY